MLLFFLNVDAHFDLLASTEFDILKSCNSFDLSYNMIENTEMRIFGQISDLHQARMVREERER